jgi:SAM-dependent methyltransferase
LITFLDRTIPSPDDRPEVGGRDHPMRKVTRQVAFEPGAWTRERAAKVAQLFDTMAAEWSERTTPERQEALRDALARGGFSDTEPGVCLEIGSGTGSSTPDLVARFESVVSLDLSREMLRHAAPCGDGRINADAVSLPVADASARCVVLVNALLFPAETARVIAPGGALVWVNSLGDRTPIHLPAGDVGKALPGSWVGVAADAGWGTWSVLRRAE